MKNCNEVIRRLPDMIAGPTLANGTQSLPETGNSIQTFRPERYLREGCYLLTYREMDDSGYDRVSYGTMRVDHQLRGTIASGDLYYPNFSPAPSPGAGIPIFPIGKYWSYLRVTEILHGTTTSDHFTLRFGRYWYDRSTDSWSDAGDFRAEMSWVPAPASYPSEDFFLVGDVVDGAGLRVARLTMGWVDSSFRKATIEMDRVDRSPFPSSNGFGIDWETVFENVGWDINVVESEINLPEPSGAGWNLGELHASMLEERDLSDLDREWRYHLQCVRRIDYPIPLYGIMFDWAFDPNHTPREGAAINSGLRLPNTPEYDPYSGLTFGEATPFYFRTAVHEIGHAMGLPHLFSGTSFMARTQDIRSFPGPLLGDIQWGFSTLDVRRMRHWPDLCVRPGGLPFTRCWETTPLSGLNYVLEPRLAAVATPLLEVVPIGAPVRINLSLENTSDKPVEAPNSLSLAASHVKGWVETPCGAKKSFKSLLKGLDWAGPTTTELTPGESLSHDLTLLRSVDGPLFANSGLHKITVEVEWESGEEIHHVSNSCHVMITPPVNEAHAKVATKLLTTPEVLLVLVLGGDHLKKGIEAIQDALKNKVLRPHYAIIEAKRLAQRFRTRKPDIGAACKLIDKASIFSASEASRLLSFIGKAEEGQNGQTATKEALLMLKQKAKSPAVRKQAVKE